MRKLFSCLLLVFITVVGFAQSETTVNIYNLEDNKTLTVPNQRTSIPLKLTNSNRNEFSSTEFGSKLENAIYNGDLTIYSDKKCQKAISKSDLKAVLSITSMDTIFTFNPQTFEEEIRIIRKKGKTFPIEKNSYELEQEWIFNTKSQELEMSIKAIHVFYQKYTKKTKTSSAHYVFSMKGNESNNTISSDILNNSTISWAKQINYNMDFQHIDLRNVLLDDKHLKKKKIIDWEGKIITKSELENFKVGTITDTIITFNPETFEETVKIVTTEFSLDSKEITKFRVAQDFYYDEKSQTLKSRLLAIAPMRNYKDEIGNFRYAIPIFWIVYNDDFLKSL